MKLESLINVKLAMRKKESKSEVKRKYLEYSRAYDNAEKSVGDKIRHREMFEKYTEYMRRGENWNE